MKIYTKTGDKGMTSLANGQRIAKDDLRLDTYGTSDELNATIGWLRASLKSTTSSATDTIPQEVDATLCYIQNKLFNLGASLSGAEGVWIEAKDTSYLEQAIDRIQSTLPPLRAFILPAGGESASRCHLCRVITRRLERRMVSLNTASEEERRFVNRLSDYFFVLARYLCAILGENEAFWQKELTK